MTESNPRLSLCMIVRDESAMLRQCLESAKDVVDEICILDTGSHDNTIEIARSFDARIATTDWCDDFSRARNLSLDMAKGEWILVLDADEVLRPGAGEGLQRVMENPEAVGASLHFTNDYGDQTLDCLVPRLFRNKATHRFQNIIHEQIMPSLLGTIAEDGGEVVVADVHVDHFGYRPDVRESQGKDERNRRLFERAVEADPSNPYLWYKFGDFLRRTRERERVVECLERSLALLDDLDAPEVARITYCAEAVALLALEKGDAGDWAAALSLTSEAMNRYAPSAMLFWTHGQACLENSQFSAATKAFRQCMEQAGRPTHVPARPHITGGRSQLGLARAAAGDGDSDGAATLIHEGAERFSDCAEIQLARVRLQVSTGELDLAMRGVTRWLSDHQSDGEAWAVGAEVLLECGLVADAAVWGERALATITEDRNAIAFAVGGEVLLAQGDYDSALNAWLRAPTDQRCLAGIAILCLMTQEALPEEIDGHSQHMALRVAEIARRLSRAPDQGPWELLQRALEDADAGTFPFIEYLNLPVSV